MLTFIWHWFIDATSPSFALMLAIRRSGWKAPVRVELWEFMVCRGSAQSRGVILGVARTSGMLGSWSSSLMAGEAEKWLAGPSVTDVAHACPHPTGQQQLAVKWLGSPPLQRGLRHEEWNCEEESGRANPRWLTCKHQTLTQEIAVYFLFPTKCQHWFTKRLPSSSSFNHTDKVPWPQWSISTETTTFP